MPDAHVVSFSSAKGGSGKTVTCASFGVALSSLGIKTLLIDADSDTAGLSLLYLDAVLEHKRALDQRRAAGVFDEPAGGLSLVSLEPNLDLLPGQYELRIVTDPRSLLDPLSLALAQFRQEYDAVLVDAQAGSDGMAIGAAQLSDTIVIVSEFDPISAQGVKRLEQLYPGIFSHERTWVLYNKVLPEISKSVGSLLRIERHLTPISWDVEVVRRFVDGKLAIDMDVPNPYTLAIVENLGVLFRNRVTERITDWRARAAETIRAPVKEQLASIEVQLDELTRERIELETQSAYVRRRRFLVQVSALVVITAATLVAAALAIGGDASTTAVRVAVGLAAAATGVVAAATLSVARSALRPYATRGRSAEVEIELARNQRRYAALEERRRQLATSGGEVAEALGVTVGLLEDDDA
jgi:cellulose biosynthesis protein BcsQ